MSCYLAIKQQKTNDAILYVYQLQFITLMYNPRLATATNQS